MSPYHLIYWPGLPGRGEHIRLVLEEAGAEYTDTAHIKDGVQEVISHISGKAPDDGVNPPIFAPPLLRHGDVLISQTPNILLYLGEQLGLLPDPKTDSAGKYRVNELVLTALDGLSNEVHDCHHPIAVGLYYEDQKEESKRRSEDYVKNRLPKFLGHFERVLESKASGGGKWLYGGKLTVADLVMFQVSPFPEQRFRGERGNTDLLAQCLDGLKFMFPKAIEKLEKDGKHGRVFALHDAVKKRPNIKKYLQSERRQPYSNGIYRYYEELDSVG